MTYHLPTRNVSRNASAAFLGAIAAILCTAAAVAAQDPDTDDLFAPPHLSIVEGAATLDRDGALVPAEAGQILAAGDRLTTRAGRVEILFGDGSALHLDEATTVDLLNDDLLRLIDGRALLHVAPSDPPYEYRIDTPAASIRTAVAGEYRIIAGPVSELAVARGLASIATAAGSLALRSGEMIQVRPGQPLGYAMPYNAAAWDPFDRWSQDRRRPRVAAIASAPLQGPLVAYNTTLSRHGTWSHHADYGDVWYPHVASGWRPFYNGRWTTLAPYGWTWAGGDPWAWPTHYYGSWRVTGAGAWFWIPGVRWRPAAVHWTVTNTHVGWVPWGFGVEVFGFTVVPRSVFHVNVHVPRHAVRVNYGTLRPLAVAVPPPLPRGLIVPRAFGSRRLPPARRSAGDGGMFANRDDRARPNDAVSLRTGVQRRVAQPRNPPAGSIRSRDDDGVRATRNDGGDGGRPDSRDVDRRAGQRVPTAGEREFPALREQAPLREQPALRELPPLRSQPGIASGGAEWRMPPRRESRDESRPEPRRETSHAGESAGAVRRAPPAERQEPRAERQESRESGGERRAVPRKAGSSARRRSPD